MKKFSLILLCLLILITTAACSNDNASSNNDSGDTANSESTGFVLEYPSDLQALGYTDAIVMDEAPQKVACISVSPVMCLYNLGVNITAVPSSSVISYPDDMNVEILPSLRSNDFDVEIVVDLNPDLVIMPYTVAETHGATLEGLGITTYYVNDGHGVTYDSIKLQTQTLIDAFTLSEKSQTAGEAIMQSFTDLESRLEEVRALTEGKTVMVVQSATPPHYIQTRSGTLGSMLDMIGFTNVYTNEDSFMVQLDLEAAIEYDPDLIFCVGSAATSEEQQKLMEAEYDSNSDYWNSYQAISEGDVIYMPVTYISSTGISIVDYINDLINLVEERSA